MQFSHEDTKTQSGAQSFRRSHCLLAFSSSVGYSFSGLGIVMVALSEGEDRLNGRLTKEFKKGLLWSLPVGVILCCDVPANANPIFLEPTVFGPTTGNVTVFYIFNFFFIVLIEFFVLLYMLKPSSKKLLFFSVFTVHLVSYPITVFLGWFILYLAEIVPIYLEYRFYLYLSGHPRWQLASSFPSSRKRCFQTSLAANLTTFFLGVVLLQVFATPAPSSTPARAKADMRSMATALESYAIDHEQYPFRIEAITTPLAYMTDLPLDPFKARERNEPMPPIPYLSISDIHQDWDGFIVWTAGPDGDYDTTRSRVAEMLDHATSITIETLIANGAYDLPFCASASDMSYDPTNGSNSSGDIWRLHGAIGASTE